MGIKYNEIRKKYEVSYSRRHPLTGVPQPIKRININTLAEAKRVYNQIVVTLDTKLKAVTIPTWSKLLDAYFDIKIQSNEWTMKTCKDAQYLLNAYTREEWGARLVDSIKAGDVKNLILSKLSNKSTTTKQSVLKFVKGAFNFAVENSYIVSNPVPKMNYKQHDKFPPVLSAIQAKFFLEKAKELNSEWYYHWVLALYSGMRNSEQFSLTWEKIDFENRTILVDTGWNKFDGFKCTKSGDDRVVEIAPNLLLILKELKLKNLDSKFVLPRSRNWNNGEQSAKLGDFLEKIGLPRVTYHCLRASWCTMMLSNGVEPVKLMASGGWKSFSRFQIYVRKAGVNVKGSSDKLNIHNPHNNVAKVYNLASL